MSYSHLSDSQLYYLWRTKQEECVRILRCCANQLDSWQSSHDNWMFLSKIISTVANISSAAVFLTGGASAIPAAMCAGSLGIMGTSTAAYTYSEKEIVNNAQEACDESMRLLEALYKRALVHWSNGEPLNTLHDVLGKMKMASSSYEYALKGLDTFDSVVLANESARKAYRTQLYLAHAGSGLSASDLHRDVVLASRKVQNIPQDVLKQGSFGQQLQVVETVSGYLGVVLLPFDVVNLFKSASSLNNGSFSDVARKLREKANQMEQQLYM